MSGQHIMVVANECSPDVEDEYNRWYTEVHLPMFFEYEGMKQASRYKIKGDTPSCSKYMAVYEFETGEALDGFTKSDAFKKAVEDFEQKWKEGQFLHKWGASYELLTRHYDTPALLYRQTYMTPH